MNTEAVYVTNDGGGWRAHKNPKELCWEHRGTDQGKVQQNIHNMDPVGTDVTHLFPEKLIRKQSKL